MLFNRLFRPRKSRRPVKTFSMPARWNAARLRLEALDERVVPAFLDAVNYAAGSSPQGVVTGDFNNDSVLDLAVAGGSSVNVLLGNGNGTFQPAVSFPAGNSANFLAAGDFNADGRLDLATAGYSNPMAPSTLVTLLLGDGNGAFQQSDSIVLSSYSLFYSSSVQSLTAGDFDGDGVHDLAAVTGTSWSSEDGYSSGSYTGVVVLFGAGTGTFGGQIWSTLDDGLPYSAAVADFNGDGSADIATVTDSPDGYFLNVALSFYPTNSDIEVGYTIELIASDLNNDGNIDLVATDPYGGSVEVLLGTGTGSFGNPQSYTAGPNPYAVAAADFNGNGIIDLITTNYPPTVSVLLGTGTGAFTPPVTAGVGSYPVDVAVGDFNGDGMMDAATANSGVSVLINDGVWDGTPPPLVPSITINDVTVTEGNTGTITATFTVCLSGASVQPVTVNYGTADSTAVTGSDYEQTSGSLTFSPGETSKTVTVAVIGDRVPESTETFVVNLGSASNASIADGLGIGTILDNEPRISISDEIRREGKAGRTTLFTFTVTLSVAYDQAVTMSFRTVDGTATTGDGDYVAKTGALTFAPGEMTKTITIEVKGDSKKEADETFYLDLFGNSSNSLFSKNRGIGTILNDD